MPGSGSRAAGRDDGHRPVLLQLLALKVLDGHLRNRHQLMDPPLSDLRGLDAAEASLLIRAMSAAAHADGRLDADERRAIAAALAAADQLDAAEKRRLEESIDEPPCLESLVRQVGAARTAARFYAVSLRTVDRNSKLALAYLGYLAQRLGLPGDLVLRLNRQFGMRV
ncbi:MAG TPA: DUF533 domain-containing protein [Stellaceae bacterium]